MTQTTVRILQRLAFSLLLATALFATVRLGYDLTRQEDYWAIHSRGFILTELFMVWLWSVTAIAVTPRFRAFAASRAMNIYMEYALAGVTTVICVVLTMTVSHSIDSSAPQLREIVLPAIIGSMTAVLAYAYYRSRDTEKRMTEESLKLARAESLRLAGELQLLRAQFHPHFLFNMLNTIYFQIDEKDSAARTTIENLSAVLRYQLYTPDEPVDISAEVTTLRHFIDLCRLRCSDRLRLSLEIPDELPPLKIYPLLLIPLIENAFKYAGGDYRITIRLSIEDNSLLLRVENSLPQIPKKASPGGLGLDNLRRRLSLLYPHGAHSLEAHSESDRFTATMRLKLNTDR